MSRFVLIAKYILSVSVGVVLTLRTLLKQEMMAHADAAMYRAKEQGRNRFCYYSDDLEYQFKQRQSVEKLLRHAIEQDKLFYQPKLALLTEKLLVLKPSATER